MIMQNPADFIIVVLIVIGIVVAINLIFGGRNEPEDPIDLPPPPPPPDEEEDLDVPDDPEDEDEEEDLAPYHPNWNKIWRITMAARGVIPDSLALQRLSSSEFIYFKNHRDEFGVGTPERVDKEGNVLIPKS